MGVIRRLELLQRKTVRWKRQEPQPYPELVATLAGEALCASSSSAPFPRHGFDGSVCVLTRAYLNVLLLLETQAWILQ